VRARWRRRAAAACTAALRALRAAGSLLRSAVSRAAAWVAAVRAAAALEPLLLQGEGGGAGSDQGQYETRLLESAVRGARGIDRGCLGKGMQVKRA
jgi:hypothetical protein